MSIKHSIKIEDDIYRKLDYYRGKRETFSMTIGKLLLLREGMIALTSTLEGLKEYAEFRAEKLNNTIGGAPRQDSP